MAPHNDRHDNDGSPSRRSFWKRALAGFAGLGAGLFLSQNRARAAERLSLSSLQSQIDALEARFGLLEYPVGEIRIWPGTDPPPGWMVCDGSLLPIADYLELFALIGNTFGGWDNEGMFALPDLRGRVAMGVDPRRDAQGRRKYRLGDSGGLEGVVLSVDQLPPHNHPLFATNNTADETRPGGNALATSSTPIYRFVPYPEHPTARMVDGSVGVVGAGNAILNLQPYTVLNFIIAVASGPPA